MKSFQVEIKGVTPLILWRIREKSTFPDNLFPGCGTKNQQQQKTARKRAVRSTAK
jgi:hypothetical protein